MPASALLSLNRAFHPLSYITADGPWHHIQIDTSIHLPISRDGTRGHVSNHRCIHGIRSTKDRCEIIRQKQYHEKLWKIFWSYLVCLKIIQSDNGPEFVNDVIRALVRITGIDHRLISPYNPRADGKVERVIGSTMSIIKKLLHGVEEKLGFCSYRSPNSPSMIR